MDTSSRNPAEEKRFYDIVYGESHESLYGDEEMLLERNERLFRDTTQWLGSIGLMQDPDARLLEVGCGVAYLSAVHRGWHGVEYSRTAVERGKSKYGDSLQMFEADAQGLPFGDGFFDAVITWSTLEHVRDPHRAMCEIDRVLKVGGAALIAPAWNCRSWTVSKLESRSYSVLNLYEKLQKATIPLRETLAFRMVSALPRRFYNELMLHFARKPLRLSFRTLNPRWDLIVEYGHVSDDDALAQIDPHSAIVFFKSRGYEIVSHPGMLDRLLSRHGPVSVVKSRSKG